MKGQGREGRVRGTGTDRKNGTPPRLLLNFEDKPGAWVLVFFAHVGSGRKERVTGRDWTGLDWTAFHD